MFNKSFFTRPTQRMLCLFVVCVALLGALAGKAGATGWYNVYAVSVPGDTTYATYVKYLAPDSTVPETLAQASRTTFIGKTGITLTGAGLSDPRVWVTNNGTVFVSYVETTYNGYNSSIVNSLSKLTYLKYISKAPGATSWTAPQSMAIPERMLSSGNYDAAIGLDNVWHNTYITSIQSANGTLNYIRYQTFGMSTPDTVVNNEGQFGRSFSDPRIWAAGDGTLYISYRQVDIVGNSAQVSFKYVSRAPGATAWSVPQSLANPDSTMFYGDYDSAFGADNVWHNVYIYSSPNAGSSYTTNIKYQPQGMTTPVTIMQNTGPNNSRITDSRVWVTSDGTLYVSYNQTDWNSNGPVNIYLKYISKAPGASVWSDPQSILIADKNLTYGDYDAAFGQSSCGNGAIDSGEDCDGSNLNGKACTNLDFGGGTLSCTNLCKYNTSACTAKVIAPTHYCGDGIIDTGEDCDGSNLNGKACTNLDFGGGTLSCNSLCKYNTSACTPKVVVPTSYCGDGMINPDAGEECDGSNLNNQSCTSRGYYGGTLGCTGQCKFDIASCVTTPPAPTTICGDGKIDAGEECDSSNLNGQSCLSKGYAGGDLGCYGSCRFNVSSCKAIVPVVVSTTCGNGRLDAGEQCDGSNLYGQSCFTQGFAAGTLACNSQCGLDTSACTGGTTPTVAYCGNDRLDNGEQCDGSNLNNQTCASMGFVGGSLGCYSFCKFNTSSCTTKTVTIVPPPPPPATSTVISCSDSDRGKIYDIVGTVYGIDRSGRSYLGVKDQCLDATKLKEYYCDAVNGVSSLTVDCPKGCQAGVCLVPAGTVTPECTLVENVDNKGRSAVRATSKYNVKYENRDICSTDGKQLLKWTCADVVGGGKQPLQVAVPCSSGCLDGICKGANSPTVPSSSTCRDSDAGINLYTRGYTYGYNFDQKRYLSVLDTCLNPIDIKSPNLREYYCDATKGVLYKDSYCQYGCKDGACLNSSGTVGYDTAAEGKMVVTSGASGSGLIALLATVNKSADTNAQQINIGKYTTPLNVKCGPVAIATQYAINNFITYGTPSLTAWTTAQRYQLVADYCDLYKTLPSDAVEWKALLDTALNSQQVKGVKVLDVLGIIKSVVNILK